MTQTADSDHIGPIFVAFDAKEAAALAQLVIDGVKLRIGNAPAAQGKLAFVVAVKAFLGSMAGFRHGILNLWRDGHTLIHDERSARSARSGSVAVHDFERIRTRASRMRKGFIPSHTTRGLVRVPDDASGATSAMLIDGSPKVR